eukprot:ANDGO_04255.mRNA.1 epidermal retinol dehydrogenase 2
MVDAIKMVLCIVLHVLRAVLYVVLRPAVLLARRLTPLEHLLTAAVARTSDKRVLITGAGSGIGRLMAQKFLDCGASVVAWDVSFPQSYISHPKLATAVVDVTNRARVAEAAASVFEAGSIDVLFQNAGIVFGKPFVDAQSVQNALLSEQTVVSTDAQDRACEKVMNVNSVAHFWSTRTFLPRMVASSFANASVSKNPSADPVQFLNALRHNSAAVLTAKPKTVVSVVSAASSVGVPGLADYCASKWAAAGFAESIRGELKNVGTPAAHVGTVIVNPYYINTGMFAGVQTRFSWLLPILEPQYVVEQVLRSVCENLLDSQGFGMGFCIGTPAFSLFDLLIGTPISAFLGKSLTAIQGAPWVMRRDDVLNMPWIVNVVPIARLLPVSLADALADFLGINRSMDHFTGRKEKST